MGSELLTKQNDDGLARRVTKEPLERNIDILQGSRVSPISYLFYNADTLEDAAHGNADTTIRGWIDDI